MKYLKIGNEIDYASQLALGCMRMAKLTPEEIVDVVTTAIELGINFFDHSDVYSSGRGEEVFGEALRSAGISREDVYIQSKCGLHIRPDYYFDFSKEHIIRSVEGSLKRLGTDYLDALLLHRPDALMEPEEVAEAFNTLYQQGKVRNFGVSNQNPYQMALLQRYMPQPLLFNQLQFGPAHTTMLDASLNVNTAGESGVVRDGGILDYCRLKGVTIQPWSPFQVDLHQGLFMNHPDYKELTQTITELAEQYGISFEAMVLAWIVRHPAKMQPIVGSMNPARIRSMVEAFSVELSRRDWYAIYKSAGNTLP